MESMGAAFDESFKKRYRRNKETLEWYDALAMALGSLRTANVALQNRFSPELGRRAAEIFADMTGSDWSSILLDREFHLSAETDSDPTRRNVQLLSTGPADQLYLAVRLAICEMILPPEQNPPLILDDALSAVDTDTEEHILTNLKKNREGKTTILIAHRISTIQNADIIMVLEDGTAAEIGNHDSLMAKHGIYYDMFEKQQLEAIHGEAGKALIRQNYPAAKTGKEDA